MIYNHRQSRHIPNKVARLGQAYTAASRAIVDEVLRREAQALMNFTSA